MKTPAFPPLLLATLLAFALLFAGCGTTDPRSAGRTAGAVAVIGFDGPNDAEVLQAAKERIDSYLATGQPVTDAVVSLFTAWLAAELGRNPAAVRLVVAELRGWVNRGEGLEPGQIPPAREFVAGISDALGIAYPTPP